MGRSQLSLFEDKRVIQHGGSLSIGRRKNRRPLDVNKPIHLTLRSSQAIGPLSLRRFNGVIGSLAFALGVKWGVRIYSLNVNGNHLHLVIKIANRRCFQNFLRVFSGQISMKVRKADVRLDGKFWDFIPWTRIGEWGRAFKILKGYVHQNELEVTGVIPYQPRGRKARLKS